MEEKTFLEKMAEDINKIAKAIEGIPKYGLMRRLLILYLHDRTKVSKRQIEEILDGISDFLQEFNNLQKGDA